jgi:hypothetical protein
VHRPKFSLGAGRFGSLRGQLGVGMHRREWKVTKYEPELVAHLLLHREHNWVGGSAKGHS